MHAVLFCCDHISNCCVFVLFQGKGGLGGSNELLGSCNTSIILVAVRHGINDECNDKSSDSDSWTLSGIMATTIANVLLNVIVLMTLLMICVCYFICKIKSTTTNSMELTSEYITRSVQTFQPYQLNVIYYLTLCALLRDKSFENYFLSHIMCSTI